MQRKINIIISILFCLIIVSSCRKTCEECFESSGNNEIKEIEIDSFRHVNIYDVFDIILKKDSVYKVIIEAGENIIPNVELEVTGNILNIKNNSKCRWLRRYKRPKLTLCFKDMTRIRILEPSRLTTYDTLKIDDLWIWPERMAEVDITVDVRKLLFNTAYNSAGKAIIKGKVTYMDMDVFGAVQVDASELTAISSTIKQNSVGNISVNITNSVEYSILNTGNIYCYGNPQVVTPVEIKSEGKFIKQE